MMKMKSGEKERRRRGRRPRARQTLGTFGIVALFPSDSGAELAKCQCCNTRTTKKNGGSNENATRSADQRKQLEGEKPPKDGSSQKGKTELKSRKKQEYFGCSLLKRIGLEYRENSFQVCQQRGGRRRPMFIVGK